MKRYRKHFSPTQIEKYEKAIRGRVWFSMWGKARRHAVVYLYRKFKGDEKLNARSQTGQQSEDVNLREQ